MSSDEWADIVRLVRAYARRKYGWMPSGITIHAPWPGVGHLEPFTAPEGSAAPEPSAGQPAPAGRKPDWNSGSLPAHVQDFRAVYWPGLGTFGLSETQACVVELLWEAWREGVHEVPQDVLLRKVGSQSVRLCDVFKGPSGAKAWGTLVVRGQVPGSYRLPPLCSPDLP